MGQLSRDRVDYKTDIDDLFDEPTGELEEFEDISISSCVYEPVLIGLKEEKLVSRLEKAFYPQYDREIFVKGADGSSLILPLDDIEFIGFVNRPFEIDILKTCDFSEAIETFRGGSFKIRVPDGQDFDVGLFGITTDPSDQYKYIFFPFNNTRTHCQQRRIGEIIIEKRLLSEDVLQNVLSKQLQLRSLRLGSIIAKKVDLSTQDVETTLQQAWGKKSGNGKLHSGDILIEAGLASPQVVKQSLAIQKKMRRMKVGKLLIEMGYIDEDQMYKVLAEKFRKRFVNLEKITPSDEALAHLSPDFIKKLMVMPIYFQNERLIIATSFPEKVGLSDFLKEKLSCPFELVVSPYNQISGLIHLHVDLRK